MDNSGMELRDLRTIAMFQLMLLDLVPKSGQTVNSIKGGVIAPLISFLGGRMVHSLNHDF